MIVLRLVRVLSVQLFGEIEQAEIEAAIERDSYYRNDDAAIKTFYAVSLPYNVNARI